MSPAEIASRRPVWVLLSELYLDQEIDDGMLRRIADGLARSPYSVEELQEIEVWEVAPVVFGNLGSVAGAWAGFDEQWIHEKCERRARRRSVGMRLAVMLGFRRRVRSATGAHWPRLRTLVESARSPSRA